MWELTINYGEGVKQYCYFSNITAAIRLASRLSATPIKCFYLKKGKG